MYNAHFGFTESPFNVTPDSRFFFVNPCYEEAFATLRYGIDARKGFVVITGQPGTGKTTLLKRLTCSLDSNVQSACIFDPHLSFIQLLRMTLGELGVSSAAKDRLTMMGQLYDHLIAQLEKGQIVCLMIDEAQNLSVEMLEELRLLSNLETDTDKLIQIVLVGQPEFEEKLERPELVQLKQRVALRCRLRPLEANEVNLYILSRLQTIHYGRPDLFDAESVELIAAYCKGIPRLINSICDNALLIAYTANRGYVIPQDVREAVAELQLVLSEPSSNKDPLQEGIRGGQGEKHRIAVDRGAPSLPVNIAKQAVEAPHFQFPSNAHQNSIDPLREEKTGRQFDPFPAYIDEEPAKRSRSHGSYGFALSVLIILLLGGGALLYAARQRQISIPDVRAYLQNLAGFGYVENRGQASPPEIELPTPQNIAPISPPLEQRVEQAPESASVNEQFAPAPDNNPDTEIHVAPEAREKPPHRSAKITEKKQTGSQKPAGVRIASDEEIAGKKLEIEIYKAIRDRAITGVQIVSINDGTVYLNGRVATPRQKLAAVRAALSVPGVKSVRDQILIDN